MALPKADWRVYTGTGLLIWAGALQVCPLCLSVFVLFFALLLYSYSQLRANMCTMQLHMWSIRKRPEFKEKFEKRTEAQGDPIGEEKSKTQWTVRTRF